MSDDTLTMTTRERERFLADVAARRAERQRYDRGSEQAGRWTIEYLQVDQVWHATACYIGTDDIPHGYVSAQGASREEVRSSVLARITPTVVDLTPAAVGCDLLSTGTPVVLPHCEEITLILPRSPGRLRPVRSRTIGPLTRRQAADRLRACGYTYTV